MDKERTQIEPDVCAFQWLLDFSEEAIDHANAINEADVTSRSFHSRGPNVVDDSGCKQVGNGSDARDKNFYLEEGSAAQ